MKLRPAILAALGAVCLSAVAPLAVHAQPPAAKPLTPLERYREARDLMLLGKFDLAAEQLKIFLAANPTDQDLFDIQNRYGPTVFEKLRLVPIWSEDAGAQADAIKTVDAIIAKSKDANQKFFRNPARIAKFVANLGATTEERIYAEQQLKPAGDAVVPAMLEALKTPDNPDLRSGVLGAIRRFGPAVVPGFLAGLEGVPDDIKLALLTAIVARPDAIALTSAAESDPLPWLWYFASTPTAPANGFRNATAALLAQLVSSSTKMRADNELVALARPFYERTANFVTQAEGAKKVQVWMWDAAKQTVAPIELTRDQAEEYYGQRYLRWALERNPANAAAKDMFLNLAIQRAIERSRFGVLMKSEPAAYQLLAATPTDQLIRLLDQAIASEKSAEVMGFTQGLADRADKTAATPVEVQLTNGTTVTRPPILVKALDYPDPRVQLAAAIGLLRVPGPPKHGKQARVVEVLKRALSGEQPAAGTTDKGRALIADPSDTRGQRVAGYLKQLGYSAERFATGRDLLKRVARASDFDMVFIDRHIAAPQLIDVISQLRSDANTGRRPLMVVASSDTPKPVPLERQLLRLALLIAATETDEPVVQPPFFIDPRKPPVVDVELERKKVRESRDGELGVIIQGKTGSDARDGRLKRLQRLVAAADFPPSRSLDALLNLRLPQFTYAIAAAEFPVSPDSAPATYAELDSLTKRLHAQPDAERAATGVPTATLSTLIEQLEAILTADQRAKIDRIIRRLDMTYLTLPVDVDRDLNLEDRLTKLARHATGITVIPEPYGLVGLTEDLATAMPEAAQLPRDPADKKVESRYAVDWLRRIALGDVTGYDARPAESALRSALKDDELADAAVDAVARIPSAEVQQDLLNLALTAGKSAPLRLKAADRTVVHIQAFGKLIPANQATALAAASHSEPAGDLKGKFLVIHQLLSGKPEDLGQLLSGYKPPAATAAPAPMTGEAPPPKPAEPPPPKN